MARKRIPASAADGFLEDIVEQIDDDVPRLVYADWLEDNGQPRRAEFIRLQCRLAVMGEDDPERAALLERESELLHIYQQRWAPAWPTAALWESHEFRRGFAAVLSLTCSQFRKHARKLFSASPLEEIHLRAIDGRLGEALSEPLVSRLRTLHFGGNAFQIDDLRALAECSHLTRLTRLNLERTGLTSEGLAVLAGWPGLARLTHLYLDSNGLDPDALGVLLASPHLTRLRSLGLSSNPQLREGTALLGASATLNRLSELNLRHCGIESAVLQRLVNASGLKALRSLDLSSNALRAEGALFLAHSPLLSQLTSLGLANGSLPRGGVATLAESPHLGQLRRLDLSVNGLRDEEVTGLAGAPLDSLEHLILARNRFGADGACALSRSPHLGRLTTLELNACGLGPGGMDALTSSCLLSLIHLDLDYNYILQAGAKALSRWANLGGVRTLLLNCNNIDDEGVRSVALSPHLSELRRLGLLGNHLTTAAATALAGSPHLRQLRRLRMGNNRGLGFEGARILAASPNLPHLLELQVGRIPGEDLAPLLHEHGKGVEL